MPPKKNSGAVKSAAKPKPKKAAPKKPAAKGFKLPDPIAPGEIFKDLTKKEWRLGKSIGKDY